MQSLLQNIEIKLNENLFLKDPNSSELGKRIVSFAIDLIAEIGFESFTFKKLGQLINSPEASIYRYFESKHKLLQYITSWYLCWMEYQIVFATANISSPEKRLEKAIHLLTQDLGKVEQNAPFNLSNLYCILVEDSSKSYLTKSVDDENSHGIFSGYKQLVGRLSKIILEINPEYKYPHMLISTMIEGAHYQRYFAEHLPKLTDVISGTDAVQDFYKDLIFSAIKAD